MAKGLKTFVLYVVMVIGTAVLGYFVDPIFGGITVGLLIGFVMSVIVTKAFLKSQLAGILGKTEKIGEELEDMQEEVRGDVE